MKAHLYIAARRGAKSKNKRQLRDKIAAVMAIYHFNAQVVSRSKGASAVAGAAYRSGEKLTDERTGETHDYRRRDDLDGTEIMTPREAPEWAQDRARLWNEVEEAERRKDAQVAREVRVAIPRELRQEERRKLVGDFAQSAFVDRGMVADIAYHGGKGENPHAHIMLTTRKLTQEGFGQKDRSWNSKELLASWRKGWAEHANQALERAGRGERIDHRTLVVQRDEAVDRGDLERAEKLDRDPEIHLGRAAWMMARSGSGTSGPRGTMGPPSTTRRGSISGKKGARRSAKSRRRSNKSSDGPPSRSGIWAGVGIWGAEESEPGLGDEPMSGSLSDRLKENTRLFEATKHNLGAVHSATAAAATALNDLAAKCREEIALRERVIESLRHERRYVLSLVFLVAVFGTWFGATMIAAGRWLWAIIRAAGGF